MMKCPARCKLVVWKHGLAARYSAKHPQQRLPQQQPFVMGLEEKRYMMNVAKNMDAESKEEHIGTLNVWVGALEGGSLGGMVP
eukprot:scaffold13944_cov35-Tisochrysis_lutea.AAC.1